MLFIINFRLHAVSLVIFEYNYNRKNNWIIVLIIEELDVIIILEFLLVRCLFKKKEIVNSQILLINTTIKNFGN